MIRVKYNKDTGSIIEAYHDSIEVQGDYIEVEEEAWAACGPRGTVQGGVLVNPEPLVNYKGMAQAALVKSDTTVLRCVSAGVAVPSDWQEYRVALRAIVTSGVGPLPTMPEYPEGS